MALFDEDNKAIMDGNGSQKEFEFTFKIFKPEDLKVYKIDKETGDNGNALILNYDYTVQISKIKNGGKVIYAEAPTVEQQSGIYREISIIQPAQIPPDTEYVEKILENALDRACMISQQLQEQMSRALKFQGLNTDTQNANLPAMVPDKALVVNHEGTALTLSDIISRLVVDGVPLAVTDKTSHLDLSGKADVTYVNQLNSVLQTLINNLNATKADKAVAGSAANILLDLAINPTFIESLVFEITKGNVNNNAQSKVNTALRMVSATEAGIMDTGSYNQIKANTAAIQALEGKSRIYPVNLGTDTPTQDELMSAFKEVSGTNVPIDGNTLHDLDFNKDYRWYETTNEWVDQGGSNVSLATNTSPGIVQGSTAAGKIYVENGGTMSLVGYDALSSGLQDVQSALPTKANASALDNYQVLSEKGEPDGYAPLDNDGKVPDSYLPKPSVVNDIDDFKAKYKPFVAPAPSDKRSLVIRAPLAVTLELDGGEKQYYTISEDVTINVNTALDTGTIQAGKDYYLYLCWSVSNSFKWIVSLNSTYPVGYDSSTSRKLGGFHSLCNGVTSTNAPQSGHPAIGYNTGDIVPNSIWAYNFKAKSGNSGMAYVDRLGEWWDIYNTSGNNDTTGSVYGATRSNNRYYHNFVEDYFRVGKKMADQNGFSCAMDMSNYLTAVQGAAQPNPDTTGGRVDTAGKRMISRYFLEEGCGLQWQLSEGLIGGGGSGWANADGGAGKGQQHGTGYLVILGGSWNNGGCTGPRCRDFYNGSGFVGAGIGGRGRSCHIEF